MKVVTISDLHGKSIWKKIVEAEKDADKFVFLGDYFDAFDNGAEEQIANFKEIISHPLADKFEWLLGNHDLHYFPHISKYSGYQKSKAVDIWEVLEEQYKQGKFKVCIELDAVTYSHAGITKTWCSDSGIDPESPTLIEDINSLLYKDPRYFDFVFKMSASRYGDNIFQGPMWVRPRALVEDKVSGVQVVGHTAGTSIRIDGDVYLTDCLDHKNQYLVVTDGQLFQIKNLEDEQETV